MKAEIRNARESDIEALDALAKRTIQADYGGFLGEEAVEEYVASGAVAGYMRECLASCSVMVQDGTVIGLSVREDNLIDLMMIDHVYHRQGFGTELLAHCEGRLFKEYDEISLESFEENEKANRFYRKNGWVEVKRFWEEETGLRKVLFSKERAG